MNYNKLISRGSDYTFAAANNWHRRYQRLVYHWAERGKCPRLYRLASEMDNRLCLLRKAYCAAMDRRQKLEREAAYQQVHLECPSWECTMRPGGFVYVVLAKDYEPDKIKCQRCGEALVSQDEAGIPNMLAELGIIT